MKIIGIGTYDANRTTTERSLGAALLTRPEMSANVANIWEDNYTAFSSLLARKGLVKRNVFQGLEKKDFRVIGNRKFMWSIKGYPFTKTTISGTYSTQPGTDNNKPGERGTVVNLPLLSNYYSPNDVLELNDADTKVVVMNEYPLEASGVFWYKVKLVSNIDGDYINPALLADGNEVSVSYTMFPELSETGYEKNQYPEWRTEYMTIQRMQYSISGSAAATEIVWVEHNGQKLWIKKQELAMMQRWYIMRENQLLFGKPTIDTNDVVKVKDLQGRDLFAGSGVVNQGDASLQYTYNRLNTRTIETIMQNMQLLTNGDGMTEIFVQGGQQFVWDFDRLMRDVFKTNPLPLFKADADFRGVESNFNQYSIGGVKMTVSWNRSIDAPWRATKNDSYGISSRSKEAYFFSSGTVNDNPNIELVTLGANGQNRAFVKKVIDGMATPDDMSKMYASNSVDGFQVQVLSETGVKLENEWGIASLKSK
jgi:hypothetical protein